MAKTRQHQQLRSIADLKPAPYNDQQRVMSPEAAAALAKSIERFGDLSGITWNMRTGNLVTGHQRVAELKLKGARLKVPATKTRAQAVKLGAELVGEAGNFPVRVVNWPPDDERLANLAANSEHLAGRFTDGVDEILAASRAADEELFESLRLDELEPKAATDPEDWPEVEWDASDIEMQALFIFRAPIEAQAKVRKLLAKHLPGVAFEEETVYE